MITPHVRDVLLTMDGTTRRGFLQAATAKVNDDPSNENDLTRLWWAVACQVIDLDTEERELMRELEQ
jgi:hypothetical protein